MIKAHPGRPVTKNRGLWGREGAQCSDGVLRRKDWQLGGSPQAVTGGMGSVGSGLGSPTHQVQGF